jgi:hypothetical protein
MAHHISDFSSKARQGGNERATLKTNVSAYANFAGEVKPEWAAVATVLLGANEEANAVSPMK